MRVLAPSNTRLPPHPTLPIEKKQTGHFDSVGSTKIEYFDSNGEKLGQRSNNEEGIETFTFDSAQGISSWMFGIFEDEPAGYAIDNVKFDISKSFIVFREKYPSTIDGFWGEIRDGIPGFDHVGFYYAPEDVVYESHPGYGNSVYLEEGGQDIVNIIQDDGVQAQHTLGSFEFDSTNC